MRPVADDDLIAALGGQIDGKQIVGVSRARYSYATSAPLEEVVLLTSDGEIGPLILKDLSQERLIGDAVTAKPTFVYEPLRELDTYRTILGPAGVGPRLIAAAPHAERPGGWLLIEKVPGVELWQIGEIKVWLEVARWLGAMHGRFERECEHLLSRSPHLIIRDADWYELWAKRAIAALRNSGDPRAPALAAALQRSRGAAERLAALPRTLVHGEFYPSNIMITEQTTKPGVYPIDWEMAGIGTGLIDLAAISGGFSEEQRSAFVRAYANGLSASGGSRVSDPANALALCRLHLATQWIGWAENWRPPSEHARDWLGEALMSVSELEPDP